jgi:TPR repeat protein
LFYRLAADSGESTAALRLGETFDPAFLAEARLGRMLGDLNQALHWYRRARDLGNTDAEILLRRTESAIK